jgi:hypothetical protein
MLSDDLAIDHDRECGPGRSNLGRNSSLSEGRPLHPPDRGLVQLVADETLPFLVERRRDRHDYTRAYLVGDDERDNPKGFTRELRPEQQPREVLAALVDVTLDPIVLGGAVASQLFGEGARRRRARIPIEVEGQTLPG